MYKGIFDSELKVMNLFWNEGCIRATTVCKILHDDIGWNPNTTYTVIKKCIQKGYLKRIDPGFWCQPLISKEDVRRNEIRLLIERLFEGSASIFLATFFEDKEIILSKELKDMINDKIYNQ